MKKYQIIYADPPWKYQGKMMNSSVTDHQKPDEVKDRILQLVGDLPRIELFAREKTEGWDVWGNEVESDIDLAMLKEDK
jgi:N6-adenosine-specific RNA methylase IME4